MEQSETVKNLAGALSKAQAVVEGAKKDSLNPHFKNKYADLTSVWEACRGALTENGLSVIQSPGPIAEGRMEMTTMLLHASGEWVRGSLTIPLGKVDAQAYGSATTYARRYALAAFVGVAPDDDDGEAATKNAPASRKNPDSLAQRKPEFETVKTALDECADMVELRQVWKDHQPTIITWPEAWQDAINDRKEARKAELEAVEAHAEADDEFRRAVGDAPAPVANRGNDRPAKAA